MNKPQIEIWDSVGIGVIIELPTGIVILNQTGGSACLQSKTEGIFLPLSNDYATKTLKFISPEIELVNYFTDLKYNGNGAINGIDKEDVININHILSKAGLDEFIEIDLDRLSESHEAWIRIKIHKSEKNDLIKGIKKYPLYGVLTWSNSD